MTADREGRVLKPGLYGYDDVSIGDVVETGDATVDAKLIDDFAAVSGDEFAIHMDAASARDLGFADRVAHGLLVLSLADGLKNRATAQFKAVASLGWDMRFSAPVTAGDRIRVRVTIAGMRLTSREDRGILTLEFEVTNQKQEIVQAGRNRLMVQR